MSAEKSAHPLRPYYDPDSFNGGYPAVFRPGIGVVVDDNRNTISSKLSTLTKKSSFIGGGNNYKYKAFRDLAKVNDFNENFKKNVYSDLEIAEYLDLNNSTELIKSLVESFVENYFKNLIAQPFETVRLLLQVGDFGVISGPESRERNFEMEDDDEEEEIEYFQPKNNGSPHSEQLIHTRTQTIKRKTPKATQPKTSAANSKIIRPASLNTVVVMSSLLSNEGARGLWRANNASFILNALSMTLEAWITGFICPFLQIPDPFFVDALHSPDPMKTLVLSISASVVTGLLLAPLDLIRTKLIVSSISGNERSFRNTVKNLKFFTCPISLVIPTLLNSLTTQFFKKATPYLLYFKLGVDIYGTPMLFNGVKFFSSILELFVRLPIETLLRRSQLSYLLRESHDFNSLKINENQLIIKPVEFKGIWQTFYEVYHGRQNGIEGLFRGWRVGTLNIIGNWGLSILQNRYEDQLNKTEKF